MLYRMRLPTRAQHMMLNTDRLHRMQYLVLLQKRLVICYKGERSWHLSSLES